MSVTYDFGYLQHGTAPGPLHTEKVKVKHTYADNWFVWFESKWRKVHIQESRTYIKYGGEKITVQIEGV